MFENKCSPKFTTLFAFMVFSSLCIGAAVYLLIGMLREENPSLWTQIIIPILAGVGFFVLSRAVLSYKTVSWDKGIITVKNPFMFRKKEYFTKDIKEYGVEKVKTFNGTFTNLVVLFPNGRISISDQEYTNFAKFTAYIQSKAKKSKNSK